MLIWINGPFGVGKTVTAHELHHRLPGSFLCDPEELGFGIQRMTPPELRGDFQDVPLWRQGVLRLLDRNLTHFAGSIIVPMTLVNPVYFDEMVGGLREAGHDVRHVALMASRETLLRRLNSREPAGSPWGIAQIDRCLHGLNGLDHAEHLYTDHLTHEQVIQAVAEKLNLSLKADHSTPLQKKLRRWRVQLKGIRFD